VAFALLFPACVYDPYYVGPPPHHHYHPHHHDYYYYPGVRVYFHFTTGHYFYFHKKHWIRARVLPPHIHLDPRERVRIRIDTDKPYLKHKAHKRRYVPLKNYRYDKQRSQKEREANRKWYQDYEKKAKQKKRPDEKKRKVEKR